MIFRCPNTEAPQGNLFQYFGNTDILFLSKVQHAFTKEP